LEYGFQKVSIDDVAKAAGMTKATVYYYFGSKADLFKESMLALMSRVRERIAFMLSQNTPLYDRLLEVAIAHLRATMSIDLEGYMRETKTALSAEQTQAMKAAEEEIYLQIEQGIEQAIKNGEVPETNAKFAAHAYIALLKVGNYKQPGGNPLFSSGEEAAQQIVDVFWKGFFS
jgi:AcrR family transcriptional regulator